jgi:sarcosine oxidase subunit gamma
MADLSVTGRRAPLAGRKGGSAVVALMPAEPAARLALRARAEAVPALSEALGIALPQKPKSSASAGGRHALWLGPDEWLLIDEAGADLPAAAAKASVLHSAVDVSHRNTAIIVSGEGAEATLSAGCPQDLSLAAFPVGACSRTLLGKIEVVIWRCGEEEFRVEFWRSYADYAFGFLSTAAQNAA